MKNQQAIGAISCMIRRPSDGKLIGYNVDYLGAIGAIEEALRGVANLSYKLLNVLCFYQKFSYLIIFILLTRLKYNKQYIRITLSW